MMHFTWPWVFILLPLPWLLRIVIPAAKNTSDAALHVPYLHDFELSTNAAVVSKNLRRWPMLIYILLWLCLLVAAARPQWVGDEIELPVSGRDLMMAIDLSGSMAEPFNNNYGSVNKLEATKVVASNFINRRIGDRIGLILFGDQAYIQSPLTFDRTTVKILLNEAFISLAGKATAIGDAIGLAVKRFSENNSDDQVLILLTDGKNTAGRIKPKRAAELAAKKGLKIYTIGIGNKYTRDLDENTLRDIAKSTGGRYFRARNIKELEEIYNLLDKLEPVEKENKTYRPTWSLFYWPLSAALFFAAILALAKWRGAA